MSVAVRILGGSSAAARSEEGAQISQLLERSAGLDGDGLPGWLVDGCLSLLRETAGARARATAVQAECWAWALVPDAPDLIAISPTGSGKTLAFLIPALCHLLARAPAPAQPPRAGADGGARAPAQPTSPLVLVLAPTRELCQQTATSAARILAAVSSDARAAPSAPDSSLAMACVYGGVDYRSQRAELLTPASGHPPRLLVATPGRLLSLCGEVPESTRARQRAAAARDGADELSSRGQKLSLASAAAAGGAGAEEEALPAACSLSAVSLLVLDEADRLLDMGFEADLLAVRRLIAGAASRGVEPVLDSRGKGDEAPELHSMLFSATWDARAEQLATALMRPAAVHITVGALTLAVARTVEQRFEVMAGDQRKGAPRVRRLCAILSGFLGLAHGPGDAGAREGGEFSAGDAESEVEEDEGSGDDGGDVGDEEEEAADAGSAPAAEATGPRIIVFVLHKQQAKTLAALLAEQGFAAAPLHGDMSQSARARSTAAFRAGEARVLVATDVAARGLDVRGVSHVINYSLGSSLETYVHRVGRCGRAGEAGVAVSFVVDGDETLLGQLVAMLGRERVPVPSEVLDLSRRWEAKAAKGAERGAGAAEGQHGRAAARGHGRGGSSAHGRAFAPSTGDDDCDDADDEQAAREANREKQLRAQQAKMQKERVQQKSTKHQGRGRGGGKRH